jgi:phage gp37-like protein
MAIKAIEDNLIERIKVLLTTKVRTVESLPGDWDADMFKRLLRMVPGVFVVFAGGAPKEYGGESAFINARWVVIVATGNASGEAARRRGDGTQIGAYEILEQILAHLHGYNVPDEGSLSLVSLENLYSGEIDKQGLAVYAATFQMPMSLPADLDLASLTPFETFDAFYDIPKFETDAERQKWLDGDQSTSKPDAEDTVAVPQI